MSPGRTVKSRIRGWKKRAGLSREDYEYMINSIRKVSARFKYRNFNNFSGLLPSQVL